MNHTIHYCLFWLYKLKNIEKNFIIYMYILMKITIIYEQKFFSCNLHQNMMALHLNSNVVLFTNFTIPWPKVSLSVPAQNANVVFSTRIWWKNSIRTTGEKLTSPQQEFGYLIHLKNDNNCFNTPCGKFDFPHAWQKACAQNRTSHTSY